MCFITHNRLILVIAVLSIGIGFLTLVSSALIIHHADELGQVTVHIKFLIACTFCTMGAGIIQTLSSLLYLCRRLITRHWITTNAVVFGIFLLGICTAMVRFQSTLPGGFDPQIVANRTQNHSQGHGHHPTTTELTLLSSPSLNSTSPEVDPKEVEGNSMEVDHQSGRNDEAQDEAEKEDHNHGGGKVLEAVVAKKAQLLKLYFGVIMLDFLAIPIFLGLVSSKASKFDLKGKSLIETW